jgi:hypothetical protein
MIRNMGVLLKPPLCFDRNISNNLGTAIRDLLNFCDSYQILIREVDLLNISDDTNERLSNRIDLRNFNDVVVVTSEFWTIMQDHMMKKYEISDTSSQNIQEAIPLNDMEILERVKILAWSYREFLLEEKES